MMVAKTPGVSRSRPSIRDVAKRAGVSTACVSNVINRRRSQEDEIGVRVMEAVAELGYRTNPIASNLRRANSRFIGVVIPDFRNAFFGELLDELERCAEETEYRLVAASSREDSEVEAREVDELLRWRVAGLLIAPTLASNSAGPIGAANVPAVVIDRITGMEGAEEVGVNNADAAREVVVQLAKLGHDHVLVAYSDPGFHNMSERLDGVRDAAKACGLTLFELQCGASIETATAAFAAYFVDNRVPDAVFCLNNIVTLSAYGALGKRGRRPGDDLALVGFDDSAWMAHVHPAVAAVTQPVSEIARAAWSLLLSRIEGGTDVTPPDRLACRLETRGTLIAPRRR